MYIKWKYDQSNNIHIAAYSALYGGGEGIFIKDYSNISSKVCIFALSDEYSGRTMSLVNKFTNARGIYAGIPIRFIKERSKKLLLLEKDFIGEEG